MAKDENKPEVIETRGRPRADIEEYYFRVCPFLRLGCSVRQSCIQSQVPPQTFVDYLKNEDDEYDWLRTNVEADMNYGALLAKRNIFRKIADPTADNIEVSKWWLSKREPDEFGDKTQIKLETDEEVESERKQLKELFDYVKTTPKTIDGTAEEIPATPMP
jgi:hypothetical protein